MSDWRERMIDDEWDQAEAEYLEQINLATGAPTVRLPGLFENSTATPQDHTDVEQNTETRGGQP